MKRIAIVGGGITGLAAAYELERSTDAEIDLYEASSRLGGKLRTDLEGDLLIEGGPDCFFTRKPGVLELVRELGIEEEITYPVAHEFGMLVDSVLHLVPRGLVALNAPLPKAIRDATFLSPEGKRRALAPQPVEAQDDLSIRAFFSGRYGEEFSRFVAEPLLAGTHGGDPDTLSMRALYPTYLDGVSPAPARTALRPGFVSFRGGMQTFVDALSKSLSRTRIHLDAALEALPEADATIVAVPANRARVLLPDVGFDAIGHRSCAIATLAFRREDVGNPLDGTGFLVPPSVPAPFTGATWSSAKWAGRAPEGTVLMRVFLRDDATPFFPALRDLLRIKGDPVFTRTDLWTDALPQYTLGHLNRLAAIESRLPHGVHLAGTSYRGVGIPDALEQGRETARRIARSL